MAKILSIKKVTKGAVSLDDSILDHLFLNEGDYIAFVEENNKIYLRKTRKSQTKNQESSESPPPPTFEEKTAEFSGAPNINGSNIFDAVQDALKNPEMMKMFQDTAKQLFSSFGDLGKTIDPNKAKKNKNQEEDDEFDDDSYDIEDPDDDKDDESDDPGFKVKID